MSMFLACVFWGLMAPVGKDAMAHGISGIELVLFRVAGAAVLFWLASMFTEREHVPGRDLARLFFAGMLGLVFNQCCYIIGLSITSPINASIVTTSAPIFAMVLSALILKAILWLCRHEGPGGAHGLQRGAHTDSHQRLGG